MKRANITIPKGQLADFCRKHHIRKMALFGSVLRDDFDANSDVDVLVEFEPDHIPGLAFFAMEAELAEIMGHRVELHTPGFLSQYFRDQVIAETEVMYANNRGFNNVGRALPAENRNFLLAGIARPTRKTDC